MTVAGFSDSGTGAGLSNLSASIAWGDGTAATVGVVMASGSDFSVLGSRAYVDYGSYVTSVTVTNSVGGAELVMTGGTGTVFDAPLTGSGAGVAGVAGAAFAGTIGSFSDANIYAVPSDFTASINWGDVSPPDLGSGTVVALGCGTFAVEGRHVYANPGTYAVSITASDAGGSSAIIESTADIAVPGPGSLGLLAGATAGLAACLRSRRRPRSASQRPVVA